MPPPVLVCGLSDLVQVALLLRFHGCSVPVQKTILRQLAWSPGSHSPSASSIASPELCVHNT